jgi:hypothetical protein
MDALINSFQHTGRESDPESCPSYNRARYSYLARLYDFIENASGPGCCANTVRLSPVG